MNGKRVAAAIVVTAAVAAIVLHKHNQLSPPERSSNWAGYVAYRHVNTVEATWVLPSYRIAENLPTWVGIGGDGGCPSVVQAGTSHWLNNGKENFTIWWETWDPSGNAPPVNVPVDAMPPGTTLRIRVTIRGKTAMFDYWMQGKHVSLTRHLGSFPTCQNGADFVSEMVQKPFAFGHIRWSNCLVNGQPLADFRLTPLLLENASHQIHARPMAVKGATFDLIGW